MAWRLHFFAWQADGWLANPVDPISLWLLLRVRQIRQQTLDNQSRAEFLSERDFFTSGPFHTADPKRRQAKGSRLFENRLTDDPLLRAGLWRIGH